MSEVCGDEIFINCVATIRAWSVLLIAFTVDNLPLKFDTSALLALPIINSLYNEPNKVLYAAIVIIFLQGCVQRAKYVLIELFSLLLNIFYRCQDCCNSTKTKST